MKIKEFKGYENICPEKIDGTSEWFYCQEPNTIDVEDLLDMENDFVFEGNQVYLIHIKGEIFEPIKKEKNVFLSEPVYNYDDNAFAIIKYDFNKKTIQIIKYDIEAYNCSVIGEIPLSKGRDLINVRILQNSYILVKHEVLENCTDILYPIEKRIQLEEYEDVFLINDGKLISSKWIEDPDYREEIIIRDYETTKIIDRKDGYISIMPNGEIWMFCK